MRGRSWRGDRIKFIDANMFIYAYYKPRRRLSRREEAMKEYSKEISRRIIRGISRGEEEVMTTIVHISEIVNILKHGMSIDDLNEATLALFMLDNVKIVDVDKGSYLAAVELGRGLKLDPNDALAVGVMRENEIREIYSFDRGFDKVEGLIRLPSHL